MKRTIMYTSAVTLTLLAGLAGATLLSEGATALGQVHRATETAPEVAQEPEVTSLGVYTITAYCPCQKCCSKSDGITASGEQAAEGITIATDWKTIPEGTRVYIDGIGERIAEDKPSSRIVEKYDGKIIDLFFYDHQDALEFGVQQKEVWIIEGGNKNE